MPRYLPIAEHGLIGDLHTIALVGTDGTIDWYCCPRFDSPSVFASILDADKGGYYRIAPSGVEYTVKQLYFPDTNVLVTRFLTSAGVAELHDFMPVSDAAAGAHQHLLVRRLVGVRGSIPMRLEVEPRFDYARVPHDVRLVAEGALFVSPELSLALSGDLPLELTPSGVVAHFVLHEGDGRTAFLEPAQPDLTLAPAPEGLADELFEHTVDFWQRWLARSSYSGRWREMVNRSALTLKLLTYAPTGAMVAAATTSLPEQLGGERNWDYRYMWVRDAAFSLDVFLRLGYEEEGEAFGRFIRSLVMRGTTSSGGHPGQIMYGIDGRTDLTEEVLDHLEGYEGSHPVRVGNGAAAQLQLDIYGEAMSAFYLLTQLGRPPFHQGWILIRFVVDWLCQHWDQQDEGIWETRGGRQDFTYSRLMCWVAVDRAIRIAQERGLPADLSTWTSARNAIYEQILTRGWHVGREAFVQHFETDVLDASVLMMPLVGFIAPNDPMWLSTLDAVSSELVSDSLVYRYNPEASPDGLRGSEGTFSICTFWYVSALAQAGRMREARLVFEKMLTYANHVGLFAEQIGPTGEQLGNFPQAFTHLSLIRAAIDLDQRLP